jgi:tetratricopeptide (TPR) repeat protein
VNKYFTVMLLSSCLLLSLSPAASELPDWLAQVDAEKHQQPEAMLALLQQHQSDVVALPDVQQAQWYYQHASLLNALGRFKEQQRSAEQGLALLAQQQSVLKVKVLYELGFAKEMQTDYPAALQSYQQGIALATLLDDEKHILLGQINHAAMLSIQNQPQQALALLKDTYQRAVLLNDTEVLAEVTAELGLRYASMAYENEAIGLLHDALKLYEQLNWPKNQITVLFNLARTYSYLEQYELSLQTYNQMLQKSLQVNDNVNLYHAYLGLAITSSDSGNGDAALSYIGKAEQYLPQLQSTSHISTHHYEKALIYQKLQQTSLAMQQVMLAERSLDDEGVTKASPTRLNVLYIKAQLLAEQGEFTKAYRQLDDFVFMFQDMRNKENELAIEQLRLGFDHERQVQQNRLLEQDNELKALRLQQGERDRQVQLLWVAIFGCSTLVLLILLLWQLTRRKTKDMAGGNQMPGQTG